LFGYWNSGSNSFRNVPRFRTRECLFRRILHWKKKKFSYKLTVRFQTTNIILFWQNRFFKGIFGVFQPHTTQFIVSVFLGTCYSCPVFSCAMNISVRKSRNMLPGIGVRDAIAEQHASQCNDTPVSVVRVRVRWVSLLGFIFPDFNENNK